MTDPTADAKLLPCPLEDIQILGPNTIGGDSWFGFPQTHGTDNRECTWKDDSGAARLILWFRTWNEAVAFSEALRNTRPQPAPPDGEPDNIDDLASRILSTIHNSNTMDHAAVTKVIAEWHIERQPLTDAPNFRALVDKEIYPAYDSKTYYQRDDIAAFGERMYRLGQASRSQSPVNEPDFAPEDYLHTAELLDGPTWRASASNNLNIILSALRLAARPKVEEADEWLKSTELYRQWRDMKAKLAECETELAKADAVIADGQPDILPSADYERFKREAMERHAARQQQKDKS